MFSLLTYKSSSACNLQITYFNGDVMSKDKYLTNPLGFKIKYEGCSNVLVAKDAETAKAPEQYYLEPGSYQIQADGVAQFTVKINALEQDKKKNVYFNVFQTSFAVIQSISRIANFDDCKTSKHFYQLGRIETINKEHLKSYFGEQNIKQIEPVGEMEIRYKENAKLLYKVFEEEPNSFINFGVEDLYWDNCYTAFFAGIPQDRFIINVYSDGSWTYKSFSENKLDNFEVQKSKFAECVKAAREGKEITRYQYQASTCFIVGSQPYGRQCVQHPEIIKFEHIQPNTVKCDPEEQIANLPDKKEFVKIFGVDIDEWRKKYFPLTPFLILHGKPADQGPAFSSAEDYLNMLKVLMVDKHLYTYVVKPHPNGKVTEGFKKSLAELGVQVLPKNIPSEAVIASFAGSRTGGYYSTVMLTKQPSFIYAKNFEALNDPSVKPLLGNCTYIDGKSYRVVSSTYVIVSCVITGVVIIAVIAIVECVSYYFIQKRKHQEFKPLNV